MRAFRKIEQAREFVFLVISLHRGSTGTTVQKLSRCFDCLIAAMIIFSSVFAFVSTLALPAEWQGAMRLLKRVDDVILCVFTAEYLLRLWTADLCFRNDRRNRSCERLRRTWKYLWSPFALFDLIAILSFWLPLWLPVSFVQNPRLFTALRLFRVMRLLPYMGRYEKVMNNIGSVLREQKKELKISLFSIMALMLVASVLMYAVEHERQPEQFRNAFSGLWWAVTTITTLGYGDIAPMTALGRFCGAIITLAGVAALAVPTAILTSGFIKRNLTVEDVERLLTEKDAEQDRRLERLESVLTETHLKYEESLRARQEELRLLSEDVRNRLACFEGFLQERERANAERLALQERRLDMLANDAKSRFAGLEQALSEARARDSEEAVALQKEGLVQILEAVDSRLVGMEASIEASIEAQRQVIEGYFTPAERPEGSLRRGMRRVASWLTPWKKKDAKIGIPSA